MWTYPIKVILRKPIKLKIEWTGRAFLINKATYYFVKSYPQYFDPTNCVFKLKLLSPLQEITNLNLQPNCQQEVSMTKCFLNFSWETPLHVKNICADSVVIQLVPSIKKGSHYVRLEIVLVSAVKFLVRVKILFKFIL